MELPIDKFIEQKGLDKLSIQELQIKVMDLMNERGKLNMLNVIQENQIKILEKEKVPVNEADFINLENKYKQLLRLYELQNEVIGKLMNGITIPQLEEIKELADGEGLWCVL